MAGVEWEEAGGGQDGGGGGMVVGKDWEVAGRREGGEEW